MWDGLEVVRVFLNETAARVEAARLEAVGLRTVVATDNCGGMRPHFDLQAGVRLMVPAEQVAEARSLLDAEATDDAAWVCAHCNAAGEPGFDACWRCGKPRG